MSPGPSISELLPFAEAVLSAVLPRKTGCRNKSKREKGPKLHPSRNDLEKGNPGLKQTRWSDLRHVLTHTRSRPCTRTRSEG